ncbi:hypothetical protein G15_0613 [Enterococcus avium]|nr:hypothetical protein G15_0613 [Enterococcus avium]
MKRITSIHINFFVVGKLISLMGLHASKGQDFFTLTERKMHKVSTKWIEEQSIHFMFIDDIERGL